MSCVGQFCIESEYRAVISNTSVIESVGDVDCLKRKAEAASKARTQLENSVKAQGEDKPCPGDCECKKPEWPDFEPLDDKDLVSTESVNLAKPGEGTCRFSVDVTYRRDYRERKGKCYKKPPTHDETFQLRKDEAS